MRDSERILAVLTKLKHFAKAEFIRTVANQDYSDLPPLLYPDVQVTLDNLYEDGCVEQRMIKGGSYWRLARC